MGNETNPPLVPAEDLGWLLPVIAPRLLPAIARRSAELGMDHAYCDRAVLVIGEVLARDGPSTRPSLVEELATKGVDASGQRASALLTRAALEGLVCHGPELSGKPTYVLLSDWVSVGQAMDIEQGLAELAGRYLRGFGPADLEDFAKWSGLPMSDARAAWRLAENQLSELEVGGRKLWLHRKAAGAFPQDLEASSLVRLLPAFDTSARIPRPLSGCRAPALPHDQRRGRDGEADDLGGRKDYGDVALQSGERNGSS